MVLAKHEILERIKRDKLVEDYVDLTQQLQPASFDLTLDKVFELYGGGSIDFDNSSRVLSEARELSFDASEWVLLKKGVYKVRFKEIVRIPADLAGVTICRSSIARCGCNLYNGFWDPGYEGRGESTFLVLNEHGIRLKKYAKIAQMVFFHLTDEARELYSGVHKGENL